MLGLHEFLNLPPQEHPADNPDMKPGYTPRNSKWGNGWRQYPLNALQYAFEHQDVMAKFGYQLQQSGDSFQLALEAMPSLPSVEREGSVTVNTPFELRAIDDNFGRMVTFIRKSMTDNDADPFPIVGEPTRSHKIIDTGIVEVLQKMQS